MNIIVKSNHVRSSDQATIFGEEDVIWVDNIDLSNLCVELGLYPSTSKARNANRVGPIPTGYTEMKGNKKTPIWIWNPTE